MGRPEANGTVPAGPGKRAAEPMKFAVGYQLSDPDEEPFPEIVSDYLGQVGEVYFPWLGSASGRASLTSRRGWVDWSAQKRVEEELSFLRGKGVRLDLLFNANCYGGRAVSLHLANEVASIIEHLGETTGGPEVVTTTSPAIARTVRDRFPKIEVRASVNMRIGTVKGMQYLSDLFDSFHLQREYNRDFARIRELLDWAGPAGKKIVMLANSGCLAHCSGQAFHDNLVAHECEVDETANLPGWTPHACWNYYRNRENWVSVLQNCWVRPEDLHHYDGLFPLVKLATRMHARPGMVIEAYARRRFYGNLLDLFEPGFGPAFAPWVIDNSRFPDDWLERVSACDKACHRCAYCLTVLDRVLVRAD